MENGFLLTEACFCWLEITFFIPIASQFYKFSTSYMLLLEVSIFSCVQNLDKSTSCFCGRKSSIAIGIPPYDGSDLAQVFGSCMVVLVCIASFALVNSLNLHYLQRLLPVWSWNK